MGHEPNSGGSPFSSRFYFLYIGLDDFMVCDYIWRHVTFVAAYGRLKGAGRRWEEGIHKSGSLAAPVCSDLSRCIRTMFALPGGKPQSLCWIQCRQADLPVPVQVRIHCQLPKPWLRMMWINHGGLTYSPSPSWGNIRIKHRFFPYTVQTWGTAMC